MNNCGWQLQGRKGKGLMGGPRRAEQTGSIMDIKYYSAPREEVSGTNVLAETAALEDGSVGHLVGFSSHSD